MSLERVSLARSRRYRLHCASIGETYQIDVALPPADVWDGGPLPVVYVLDANTVFGIAAQAARFLQQADGAAPALIVGVGYCLDGEVRPRDAYGALRTRDYTPSRDAEFFARMVEARQGRPFAIETHPYGGADKFLAFLVEELRPFIASLYDIDPSNQVLVGSSLGGLFSLYAMFRRPGAFRGHGANSPSLWWNDGELFRLEQAFAAGARDLPVDLFVSVGGRETQQPAAMVDGMRRFTALLRERAYPGLQMTTCAFEDETHTSVIPAALSRALRALLQRGPGEPRRAEPAG